MSSYHSFKASGYQFEIESKYSLTRPIGHGAFGIVIAALDSESGKKVAIKKISHAFEDHVDAKRILREIKLMRHLKHENVIQLVDIIPPPPAAGSFDDVYIVQDLMETDLHRIIYSKQPLTIDHIQYFIYQIIRGLKYIHSAGVIHRDLKPSNLLVNSNCDLKICDFGLSRGVEEEHMGDLTEYVVTRWYRAPEIMLACQDYTKAIDAWSVGCIFAELLARAPLFPGADYIAQLRLICEKMGRPPEKDLDFVTSDRARKFMQSLTPNGPTDLACFFPNHTNEAEAIDMLKQFLIFNPSTRITIEQALGHVFMAPLHNAADEPSADALFFFEHDNTELPRERVKAMIWQEMRDLHPALAAEHPVSAVPAVPTPSSIAAPGLLNKGSGAMQAETCAMAEADTGISPDSLSTAVATVAVDNHMEEEEAVRRVPKRARADRDDP